MMTTAPTTYTIEFMGPPSSQAGSQPSPAIGALESWTGGAPSPGRVRRALARPAARGAPAPGAPESMQGQIQPARRGADVLSVLLNWVVGGDAVLNLED